MFKNNEGFSLIELMIVVVIIGILASIAIPSYQGFQDKAKSSGAKIELSGIYSAELAFSAEWGTYTGDLAAAGLKAGDSLQYYAVGFGAGFDSTTAAGDGATNFIKKGSPSVFSATATDLTNGTDCTTSHKASAATFTAYAGRDGKNDWTITNTRTLAPL